MHVNVVIEAGFTLQGFALSILLPVPAYSCFLKCFLMLPLRLRQARAQFLNTILRGIQLQAHKRAVEYLFVLFVSTTAAYLLLHLKSIFTRSSEPNSLRIRTLFSPLALVQGRCCHTVRRSKVQAPGPSCVEFAPSLCVCAGSLWALRLPPAVQERARVVNWEL